MSSYIPDALRLLVAERAKFCCEYCLFSQADAFHKFHIDHIISIKHGGPTEVENLAYACQFCNRNKGSDVGSFLLAENQFVRFYNPRIDQWLDHFFIENGQILPYTQIAKATVKGFNDPESVTDRIMLIQAGVFLPFKRKPQRFSPQGF